MLIKNIKTPKDLSHAEPASLTIIVREVRQHGFYSAYCNILMPDITDHDLQINEIKKLAAQSNLRVTFNATETICIFEIF